MSPEPERPAAPVCPTHGPMVPLPADHQHAGNGGWQWLCETCGSTKATYEDGSPERIGGGSGRLAECREHRVHCDFGYPHAWDTHPAIDARTCRICDAVCAGHC